MKYVEVVSKPEKKFCEVIRNPEMIIICGHYEQNTFFYDSEMKTVSFSFNRKIDKVLRL